MKHNLTIELTLLGVLALLWGSSYLFVKIAVAEIPPITLIAVRVGGAAIVLLALVRFRRESLPTDAPTWGALLIYFRLLKTLGSMGTASQSYLRAGVGIILGIVVLGEVVPPMLWVGVTLSLLGIAAINLMGRKSG